MSERESLPYLPDKGRKEDSSEEKEENRMKSDSEDKHHVVLEDEEEEQNNENQHHTIFDSSSPSISSHKSPSPPLHSPSDSPISDGHASATHGGASSPPPKSSPANSSPESSISDGHFSARDELPPIGHGAFSQSPPPAVVVAHRFQVEPNVVTKVDPGAEEGFVGVNDVKGAAGGGGNRRLRPDVTGLLRSKKIVMLSKVLLGLRITAFVFCLMSFAVLAADNRKGWALDSFYNYKEFRYNLSVNVIGSVYSGFQICDLLKYLITRKHMVEHHLRGFLAFALDQVLTYLLMSASSSAATRAYDWESNWGEDKFPSMANASVALSFVAFVAFASTSLVSGSILVRFR